MTGLSIGDRVTWTYEKQTKIGSVTDLLGERGVFLDDGGSLPLQAMLTDKGWFAYSGQEKFTIPIKKIEST